MKVSKVLYKILYTEKVYLQVHLSFRQLKEKQQNFQQYHRAKNNYLSRKYKKNKNPTFKSHHKQLQTYILQLNDIKYKLIFLYKLEQNFINI